ncbi:MAG TPA: 2-oxo-4-hydroxy-4-carboxy-5-ureidoimidazoline decarboxylase [Pilimelia sp.]|nr:2-oxo-4-hydroxy-4-carboxy-5-ureidoimidazoline decarboxylase [Pilimelia sp.]
MVALARWNAVPRDEAVRELLPCCASTVWASRVAGGRPYPDVGAVVVAGAAAVADLPWTEVGQALAAHPRIGERPAGDHREAGWSRREQAGAAGAAEPTAAALAAANSAYEQRFGHVFLIFATGRTAEQMLAEARSRLGNDEATERRVVRDELSKITRLRLERLFAE